MLPRKARLFRAAFTEKGGLEFIGGEDEAAFAAGRWFTYEAAWSTVGRA